MFSYITDIIDLTQFFNENGFLLDTSLSIFSPNSMFYNCNFTRLPLLNISKVKSGT
jgi:hypothetical protein